MNHSWYFIGTDFKDSCPWWSSGSMFATGRKVCRFSPDSGQWIFRAIKVHSMASFGWEIKPSVPCHRFTVCKRTLRAWKRCFVGKIQWTCFFAQVSPASLLNDSAGKNCQRALAEESGLIRNCARQWACHPPLNT
jgi:hypothetical protein